MSKSDAYEKYCNTKKLLDKFTVDTGFFLSELILITNSYSALLTLGKKVAKTQKLLHTKLAYLDESEVLAFYNDVDYSMQYTANAKEDYEFYQHISKQLSLSFIEYLILFTTQKYNIETQVPYKLDRFLFLEYKNMLTTMLNADTVVSI